VRIGENFCPGILHATQAKDGLLIRIRVPGGLIEATQLRAVAELSGKFADGSVEITSRANLQIRAIQEQDLQEVARGLTDVGLLPSRTHDRVRNIVASPLAGLEAEEVFETRAMVRELDQKLQAESLFIGLSPKFTFGLHGGRRRYSHDVEDLALEVCDCADRMRLLIDGVSTGCCVPTAKAVDCLLQAARSCINLAQEAGVAVRSKRIGETARIVEALGLFPGPCLGTRSATDLIEVVPGVSPGRWSECVNVTPSVPLGRLNSHQAQGIADLAEQWGADLRLTPWRGVLLGAIPIGAADEVIQQLALIGLRCDGRDGFHGIAACAGITGCEASLADVRSHAASLAQCLSSKQLSRSWTVNLSGCEKQCARRHGASAELIAGDSGYLLKVNGLQIEANCSPRFAIDAIKALQERRACEVAT
jgi:precorrin-3B synthase